MEQPFRELYFSVVFLCCSKFVYGINSQSYTLVPLCLCLGIISVSSIHLLSIIIRVACTAFLFPSNLLILGPNALSRHSHHPFFHFFYFPRFVIFVLYYLQLQTPTREKRKAATSSKATKRSQSLSTSTSTITITLNAECAILRVILLTTFLNCAFDSGK